jgi:hypothetical protein
LIELKSGFHSDVCFKISCDARLEEIKKDDIIGAFITNKNVKFEEFSINGKKLFINFN